MIISNSFNRFYWGAIINDIHSNIEILKWNNIEFKLSRLDNQGLHTLLKIITNNSKSLKDMESKELTKYLEDIRVILSDNGCSLQVDEDEWNRILLSIRN